jgi:hypothetical protein
MSRAQDLFHKKLKSFWSKEKSNAVACFKHEVLLLNS